MKLKPIATTFDPNLDLPSDPISDKAINDIIITTLLPYAPILRKLGLGTFTLVTKLLPNRAMAGLASTLYNSLYSRAPNEALTLLNSCNEFLSATREKMEQARTNGYREAQEDPGLKFMLDLIHVDDIIIVQNYVRTIRDLAVQQIPSLWETESA